MKLQSERYLKYLTENDLIETSAKKYFAEAGKKTSNKKYIDYSGGFDIYEPTDYTGTIELSQNTAWYSDEQEARRCHNKFKRQGIRAFYFLDPQTNASKYLVLVYPQIECRNRFVGKAYIKEANFEIFNEKGEYAFSVMDKLHLDILPVELIFKGEVCDDGLLIHDGTVISSDEDIEEAIIPRYVTKIGPRAFRDRTKLKSVSLPMGLTHIGEMAFEHCMLLSEISIPDTVISIGARAFYLTGIQKVILPRNLKIIEGGTFQSCRKLTAIDIPSSVEFIDDDAFSDTGLTSIVIPNSVEKIGSYLFYGCLNLQSVRLPANLKSIGMKTFAHCESLRSLDIPQTVKYIDDYAFDCATKLESIVIPNSVEEIGSDIFNNCHSLEQISIPKEFKNQVARFGHNLPPMKKIIFT